MIEFYNKKRSLGSYIDPILIHTFCYHLAKSLVDKNGMPRKFAYRAANGYRLPVFDRLFYGVKQSELGKDVYIIDSKKPGKTVFYVHGGSYWTHITAFHYSFLRRLIKKTGGRVIIPVYPKAPKHTYRDVYKMIGEAYQSACEIYGKESIVLMGDSSGGGFVTAFALELSAKKEHVPPLIAISPWLDLTCSNPAIAEINDPWLDVATLRTCGRYYAGGRDIHDPLLSPIYAKELALGKTYVFIGTYDVLYPDCLKLHAANNNINLYIYPAMDHVFPIYPFGAESLDALDKIARITSSL